MWQDSLFRATVSAHPKSDNHSASDVRTGIGDQALPESSWTADGRALLIVCGDGGFWQLGEVVDDVAGEFSERFLACAGDSQSSCDRTGVDWGCWLPGRF